MKKKAVEYTLKVTKQDFSIEKVNSSETSYNFAKKFYHDDINIYESCFIILLNRANNVTGYAKISQGGICGTIVDKKLICKYAIDALASAVILVHNHPSGNLNPSREDENLTKATREALRLFDIHLLDHLIITEEGYYSFADEGKVF